MVKDRLNIKTGVENTFRLTTNEYGYTVGEEYVTVNGITQWMINTSNDSNTLARYEANVFSKVRGNVLLGGLGSGAIALLLAYISEVDSVTVVDRNASTVELFNKGNYPFSEKLNVFCGDLFEVEGSYDFIVYDIFPLQLDKSLKVSGNIVGADWSDVTEITYDWYEYKKFQDNDPLLISTEERIAQVNKELV
jgi:hypothetical protein